MEQHAAMAQIERSALERLYEICRWYWDCGPEGEGWQSQELSDAVQKAARAIEACGPAITRGSGNIFRDLGLPNPEEELARAAADVMGGCEDALWERQTADEAIAGAAHLKAANKQLREDLDWYVQRLAYIKREVEIEALERAAKHIEDWRDGDEYAAAIRSLKHSGEPQSENTTFPRKGASPDGGQHKTNKSGSNPADPI